MSYKKGDRVRIIKPMFNSDYVGVEVGDIGIIVDVWNNGYQGRSGALIRLDWFYDGVSHKLLTDPEFDMKSISYQFVEEEFELIEE